MNKKELAKAIAEKTGFTMDEAFKYLTVFTEVVTERMKQGEHIQLVGFGTFEVVERAARMGRNPQTGERMSIAAGRIPKFKPGKNLKDEVK